jgi:hypothetical protein
MTVDDVYKNNFDNWFASLNTKVSVDAVKFDVKRVHGQIRRLSPVAWDAKVRSFKAKMPKEPLRLTLWPQDVHSMFQLLRAAARKLYLFFPQ